MPYQPTHDFEGEYINEFHRFLPLYAIASKQLRKELPATTHSEWAICGALSPEDALKLYEMAYFAGGDILEVGCNNGLSTCIIAQAIKDSGGDKMLVSVDLLKNFCDAATANLRKMDLLKHVYIVCADGIRVADSMLFERRSFAFAFIDHDHREEAVKLMCQRLGGLIQDGGFCLFHDYDDERNRLNEATDYGVFQGVDTGLSERQFEFWGIYGPSALYRRIEG